MASIQWFPGHMAKARREIEAKIKLIDIVLELRDARIPYSSSNPMIDDIIGRKPRLILLCKAKMADQAVTNQWIDYYKEKGIMALDIDSLENYHISDIAKYVRIVLKNELERRKNKGIIKEEIRAMILGIPNVGKSTLINVLAKKRSLKVADRPGVTRTQTWMKAGDNFVLLDTPGILWPKFEDENVGYRLAICGSIRDEILDISSVCYEAIEIIKKHYPKSLLEKYGIEEDISDYEVIMGKIGEKRGALLKGGNVDLEKAEKMFLNDLRNNRIGVMSYEWPN